MRLPCGGHSHRLPSRLPKYCTIGTAGTSYFKWRRSASTLSVFGGACHQPRGEKKSGRPIRPEQVGQVHDDTITSKTAPLVGYQGSGPVDSLSFKWELQSSNLSGNGPISEGRAVGPCPPGPFLYPSLAPGPSRRLDPHTDELSGSRSVSTLTDRRP